MPRFYCDYCDAYLTHDSEPGRKQHMQGWKHRQNFTKYYATFYESWIMEQQAIQMHQMQQYQMQYQVFPPLPSMMEPPPSNSQLPNDHQMQQQHQAAHSMPPPPIFRPPPSTGPINSMKNG